jgi:hypothetical protein
LAAATGVEQSQLGLVQTKATPGNPEFVLSVESATTPLSAFAARQTKRGVTANAWVTFTMSDFHGTISLGTGADSEALP